MKDFPSYNVDVPKDAVELLRYILKERPNDVRDFTNLKDNFTSGRTVGKIPTGAQDITDQDRVGDTSVDTQYIYIVVNNNGTAEWRRTALESW